MTINEAKSAVLAEWEKWADNPSQFDIIKMREFYDWLETNRPDVLQWRVKHGVDRWQVVREWINVRTS